MTTRFGIAEWYGEPFAHMSVARRQELAVFALGLDDDCTSMSVSAKQYPMQ